MPYLSPLCRLASALLAAVYLTGCSNLGYSYLETTRALFKKTSDTVLTNAQIAALPYSSAYVRYGNNPQAVVVLYQIENGYYKWVSGDPNMLVQTPYGRIVKTVGMDVTPFYSSNLDNDPLARIAQGESAPAAWIRMMDWQTGADIYSNHQVISTYTINPNASIKIGHTPQILTQVIEKTNIPTLDVYYENTFWINPDNKKVIASRQYLGPGTAPIEMMILK